MAYFLQSKQGGGGEPEQEYIFGSFLICMLETINSNEFYSNMFANMLQPQLCLVQAATFPGILKASENPYFAKASHRVYKTKSLKL